MELRAKCYMRLNKASTNRRNTCVKGKKKNQICSFTFVPEHETRVCVRACRHNMSDIFSVTFAFAVIMFCDPGMFDGSRLTAIACIACILIFIIIIKIIIEQCHRFV